MDKYKQTEYPACCDKLMVLESHELRSESDSVVREYTCSICGKKIQLWFEFEHISPTQTFEEGESEY